MKIAITGSIGSGKSSMGSFLRETGEIVFDTDKMVHDLYKNNDEVYQSVVEHFGESILNEDKTINRIILGRLVFKDSQEINKLESIVYPVIIKMIESYTETKNTCVFYEVPMLFEANMSHLFDYVVMVDTENDVAFKRLSQHRKEIEDAKERLELQMDRSIKRRKSNFVIYNNGSLLEFHLQIKAWLDKIKMEVIHDSV